MFYYRTDSFLMNQLNSVLKKTYNLQSHHIEIRQNFELYENLLPGIVFF